MISTLVTRDGFSLAKPFGPVFWGVILNLIGFGMSLVQALSYFRTGGKDRAIVKISALLMIVLDIVSSVLIISVFWTDLILHYGGVEQFMGTNTQIGVECVISACIAFVAQIYFMTQIYYVKPAGTLGNVVLYTIAALSFIGFAFGLACASVMLMNQMTPHYNFYFQLVFGASKGANAVCDILATIMMCKFLTDSKTGVKSTSNLLDALAGFFMNRGAAVMLIQVFTFIMFFAFQNPQYWLAPHLILTKLYVNTFFAILNSRSYLREKHLGTHVSSFVVNTGNTGSTQVGAMEKGSHSFGANSYTSAPMSFAPNNSVAMTTITTVKGDDFAV
ncbi:hypothetical protein B0H13DRAFT_2354329 [Mycena leptocephala]|nr:hypothetical protein B0H13DRAFT_2354329 [Mycena leptocephala]